MRVTNITAAWLACAVIATPVFAQENVENEPTEPQITFEYTSGDIVLPNKVATLHLGEKYKYMSPAEANKLLQAWGNLPDNSLQGAVLPAEVDPLSQEAWAVFVSYEDDGHVDDSDAKDIDYQELLESMQEGEKQANERRKAAGYTALTLVGWAEPPHYDAGAKKLYWAKEIAAEGGGSSLNYDVRVLGREGVLSMQAVAPMTQLAAIRRDMEPLIGITEFNEGYRYADFNKSTDRMAEYGLGALIAGGVAAKLGLFGKLFAFLLAFKKFIIIGLIAIGGFVARLFGKKKEEAV